MRRPRLRPPAAALAVGAIAAAIASLAARAQPVIDEAGVRTALAGCVQAWNRHDPAAFGAACLTDDIWFSESDDSFYRRDRGRAQVLARFDYNIRNGDLGVGRRAAQAAARRLGRSADEAAPGHAAEGTEGLRVDVRQRPVVRPAAARRRHMEGVLLYLA
jgi:hypothetical protein